MHFSPRIEEALNRASELHDEQYRKGPRKIPILVHLVSVASIVSEYTNEEDIIVAALLHDAIEDTSYTAENIRKEFGERIMGIVLGVSIPEMHNGVETGEWGRDRRRYFENLRTAPIESVYVAAADKINNFSTILEGYKNNPEGFRKDFSGKKEDRLQVYGAIADLIQDRLGHEHPLSERLQAVWKKYEAFVRASL